MSVSTRLLVVSDIYGFPGEAFVNSQLGQSAHLSLTLGHLCGVPEAAGEELHKRLFRDNAITHVTTVLRDLSSRGDIGIGFSAGGTALWRAVQNGMELRALICISSTRLRYEEDGLAIPTYVIWGERDMYRPAQSWDMEIPSLAKVYLGRGHNFYKSEENGLDPELERDILSYVASKAEY